MFVVIKKFVPMEKNGKKLPATSIEVVSKQFKTIGAANSHITKNNLQVSEVLPDRSGFYCHEAIDIMQLGRMC